VGTLTRPRLGGVRPGIATGRSAERMKVRVAGADADTDSGIAASTTTKDVFSARCSRVCGDADKNSRGKTLELFDEVINMRSALSDASGTQRADEKV